MTYDEYKKKNDELLATVPDVPMFRGVVRHIVDKNFHCDTCGVEKNSPFGQRETRSYLIHKLVQNTMESKVCVDNPEAIEDWPGFKKVAKKECIEIFVRNFYMTEGISIFTDENGKLNIVRNSVKYDYNSIDGMQLTRCLRTRCCVSFWGDDTKMEIVVTQDYVSFDNESVNKTLFHNKRDKHFYATYDGIEEASKWITSQFDFDPFEKEVLDDSN